MQVLFEEGVIRRDAGNARALREAHSRVMRNKGRVDVDQLHILESLARKNPVQRGPAHSPIFGIARHARSRNANHGWIFVPSGPRVFRCDQERVNSAVGEILTKCPDRRGDAVDSWEVNVGNE